MRDKTIKTGIDVIGDTPWGTHLCLFYQTKEDLIDILVPYFKAGLENNEFCMWVTSEPLSAKDAKRSLQKAVRNLDAYIEKGQIEILDYSQWYTKSGKWEADRVLQGWIEKENQAVKRGFDGLRLTGNTSWLEERDWAAFTKYEATVDQVICNYRMLAICTYSLDRCRAAEVMDVVSNHQFALVKREGKWKAIESAKRKRAEKALRESEQRYRDLVEDMAEGLAVGNADGILTYVNSRIVETLEYSPEEMLGKSAIAFVAEESMDLVKEEAKRQRKGIGGRFELVLTSKTGKKVPVMVSGKPLFKDGKYIGSVGTFVDITERKRVEEALRQSEKRLRTVIEASLDGIIAVNEEGRIVVFNGAAAELFQYSEKEALNQPVKILLREEAGEIHQERLEQFLNKGIGQCGHIGRRMQKTFRRKDGSFFLGEASMAGGRFDGLRLVVLSVHDISDREKAEEALQESEERYRSLVEAAPDVIYTVSAEDGSLTSLNPAFEALTGWSRAEWLGKPFVEIVHPDDLPVAVETFQKASRGETQPPYELRILSKSGEYLVGEFTSTPFVMGGKAVGELGIARDITERKKAEEELKTAKSRLQRLSHRLLEVQENDRRAIARELHDEIGQILTAAKIDLQVIRRGKIPQDLAARLDENIASLDNCLSRVRNLSLDLRPSMLDDLGLVAALRWQLNRQAERAGFQVHLVAEDAPERLHPELETVCYRIVQEALTNIAKHAHAHNVWVELTSSDREVLLSVRDDGVGFHAESALADAPHGVSFGILGMQERASLLGGKLEIVSAMEKGTTVTARFPLR